MKHSVRLRYTLVNWPVTPAHCDFWFLHYTNALTYLPTQRLLKDFAKIGRAAGECAVDKEVYFNFLVSWYRVFDNTAK